MNFFILAFYWFSILSYFLILILPTQNRFLFSAILLLPLFLIFLKKAKSSFENIKKIPLSYYLVLLLYLSIGIYAMHLRWVAEPYGMWDAWVNWNLKAKIIANEFLYTSRVNFANESWVLRDYPLAISMLHASFSIILGGWTEGISYFIQTIFFLVIGGLFVLYAYSKKLHYMHLLFPLLFLGMNGQFLNIASDLCAEMALGCFIVFIYYSLITKNEEDFNGTKFLLRIGFLFATPMILKNEGLIHSLIFLFSYSVFLFYKRDSFFLKKIVLLLIPFLLLFIILGVWKYTGNKLLPDAYIQNSNTQILDWELIRSKLSFIQIYIVNFHYYTMSGVFIIAILSSLLTKKIEFILVCIHLILILIIYNLIFVFSVLDISWHLHTAYIRIHAALIAPVVFLIWTSVTTLLTESKQKI